MKTTPKASFAGFNYPKFLYELPVTDAPLKATLLRRAQLRKLCGPYCWRAPVVRNRGASKLRSFYLDGDFSFGRYTNEVGDILTSGRRHTWHQSGEDDAITGIVVFLPHGRFLPGWTYGEGMSAIVDTSYVFDDLLACATCADDWARFDAEGMYCKSMAEVEEEEED